MANNFPTSAASPTISRIPPRKLKMASTSILTGCIALSVQTTLCRHGRICLSTGHWRYWGGTVPQRIQIARFRHWSQLGYLLPIGAPRWNLAADWLPLSQTLPLRNGRCAKNWRFSSGWKFFS